MKLFWEMTKSDRFVVQLHAVIVVMVLLAMAVSAIMVVFSTLGFIAFVVTWIVLEAVGFATMYNYMKIR